MSRRSLLVFRTGHLGDAVLSVPAVRAIKAGFPQHDLVLLTTQHGDKKLVSPWHVLGPTGLFDDVIFHNPLQLDPTGMLDLFRVVSKIRKYRPEMLFWLREVPWNHVTRDLFLFRILCGIPKVFGLDASAGGSNSSSTHDGLLPRLPSEADRMLAVVSRAGINIPPPGHASFGLPISKADEDKLDRIWGFAQIPAGNPVIALGPVSKMPAKRWPVERFIEVAKRVAEAFPEYRMIVVGGAGDRHVGILLEQAVGEQVLNLAGELSVMESAEALRRCRLYIGNDTGIMHLAAAVGTPCVALFSARDFPGRWDPYGPNHIVLRRTPPCSGCFLTVCKDHDMECLKEISADEVTTAVFTKLHSEVGEVLVSKR